jgi:hypothetical protein
MKWSKPNVNIEEGMERLASFVKNYHGEQDWENTIYNIQDYLAAFIGTRGKEVYQDLMERLKEK